MKAILILSHLRIEDENVLWEAQKPLDLIVNATDSNYYSFFNLNLFAAKALPEWAFKYFSNSRAMLFSLKHKDTSISQGAYSAV